MIIYKVTNLINGKIYIGQTIQSLNQRRWGRNTESKTNATSNLNKSIRKYGKDKFEWRIIRICDDIKSLNAFEQYYILYYDSMDSGYNMTSGGKNYKYSDELKQKRIGMNRKSLPFRKRLRLTGSI